MELQDIFITLLLVVNIQSTPFFVGRVPKLLWNLFLLDVTQRSHQLHPSSSSQFLPIWVSHDGPGLAHGLFRTDLAVYCDQTVLAESRLGDFWEGFLTPKRGTHKDSFFFLWMWLCLLWYTERQQPPSTTGRASRRTRMIHEGWQNRAWILDYIFWTNEFSNLGHFLLCNTKFPYTLSHFQSVLFLAAKSICLQHML